MAAHTPNVLFFKQIDKHDADLVGGIAANLGELTQVGFPVPPGFSVTSAAFKSFAAFNGLHHAIREILNETDVDDAIKLQNASRKIQKVILNGDFPKELADDIVGAYQKLSRRLKKAAVVIRTSENETEVRGEAVLLEELKKAWAESFAPQALRRVTSLYPNVIVQLSVPTEVAGTIYSADPVTHEHEKIVVHTTQAVGRDKFIVHKNTFDILAKETVSDEDLLSEDDIVELAKLAHHLQEHYYFPQEADWAKTNDTIYVLLSRPLSRKEEFAQEKQTKKEAEFPDSPILTGISVSQGIGTGHVGNTKGEVHVIEKLTKEALRESKHAAAIVVESDVPTEIALLARDMGIPTVMYADGAVKKLRKGDLVTVDASTGEIYKGKKIKFEETAAFAKRKAESVTKSATRILVNLYNDKDTERLAKSTIDGIGVLKGKHELSAVCKQFYPRPVMYQPHDLESEIHQIKSAHGEYNNLAVMIPEIKSAADLALKKREIIATGIGSSTNFKIWASIDFPANVIEIEPLLETGLFGVSINVSHLASHMIGMGGYAEIDSSHEALSSIEWAVKRVIKACQAKKVNSQISFQSDSIHDELLEKAVRFGVTNVSVNPIAVERIRHVVAETEKSMIH